MPIDTVDPPLTGSDERPRQNPAEPGQIERLFHQVLRAVWDGARPVSGLPPAADQLVGLNLVEVRQAMALSLVDNLIARGPEAKKMVPSSDAIFDAKAIDEIRHRWGRVA